MRTLARDFASFVRQAKGKARKCLALDLDNTLWGGIIGEDGLEGIKLGHDGIGRAFMDFQREVLRLHEQGVILAVCSKNNEADALEVFQKHPDMVLKLEHFAALRINWLDKPGNLRSLAEEINIGIDSFVFLDDNPIERGAVRQLAPEVLVPDLPRDPAEYPDFVRGLTCFNTLQLTDEDLKRGQFYAAERQRKTLQESAGNLDDYLKSLGMLLHVTPIDDFTRPRIVQLIHRTNQFNLTTRRHSEVDVLNMTPERGYHIFSIRLEDRYGDNGTVGVAILRLLDDDPAFPRQRVALLDTLLMSCRILGRNVEQMFLAYLTDFAAQRGAQQVIGEFVPSAKNRMVADFYPKFGYDPLPANGNTRRWALPLTQRRIERPPYITVRDGQ
jgi:FkbH-like protein